MLKLKTNSFLLALLVILPFLFLSFLLRSYLFMKEDSAKRIIVFTLGAPDSSDPLKYDSFVNHIAFTSVNGNLVSQYKLGEHNPEIAQSWTVNHDHTEWLFKIRPNATFSDGSLITGQTVLASWIRMAKIMKSRNSKSGFF
jgi:ABC-type transport system substrate-binding protein